ncbi:MAG: aminotransferase class I/II-fold pyridoxal phosphate-dependent enzyme [Promethearchaeota archaeon]
MDFEILKKTPLWTAFSSFGKEIFQPNGVFYWSGRAKQEAEINGTIGTIWGTEAELLENNNEINNKDSNNDGTQSNKKLIPFYIPALKDFTSEDPVNIVPYAPILGLPSLRKYWQEWIITKAKSARNMPTGSKDLEGRLSLPAIVPGITFGINMAVRMFLSPSEILISPDKRWGNYDSIISRNLGVKIKSFTTFTDTSPSEKNGSAFSKKFNIDAMKEAIKEVAREQNKVVILINFPNNPTGYVPTKEEAEAIVKTLVDLAKEYGPKTPIVVICDDAYEGYVYNEIGITGSLFYELVNTEENIIPIKLDGSSKEMLLYGARIAALTLGLNDAWYSPGDNKEKEQLLNEFNNKCEGIVRSTISNSNRYCQTLLIKMFQEGINKIVESRKSVLNILKDRYNLLNKLLMELQEKPELKDGQGNSLFDIDPNAGGFFLLININPKIDATKLNEHLLEKYKVGFIPIVKKERGINSLRIAYCSVVKEKIPTLVERLGNALDDLK